MALRRLASVTGTTVRAAALVSTGASAAQRPSEQGSHSLNWNDSLCFRVSLSTTTTILVGSSYNTTSLTGRGC